MDWLGICRTIQETVKKYRYVMIVLLIGLFLMMSNEDKFQQIND